MTQSQPMKFASYVSNLSPPSAAYVLISGSGNNYLTSVVVSIDPNMTGGSATQNNLIVSDPATGQYAKPGATIGVSPSEFSQLVQELQAGSVTDVYVFYGSMGANGHAPVQKFEYKVSVVNAQFEAFERQFDVFEKRVGIVEHELKQEIALMKVEIGELKKKLLHPMRPEPRTDLS